MPINNHTLVSRKCKNIQSSAGGCQRNEKTITYIYLLTIAQSAYSANLTEVKIIGEKIEKCSLSRDSVSAALGSTMRYNRINLIEKYGGVYLYHAVVATNIPGGCTAFIKVEFKVYEDVFVKNLNKKIVSDVVLCSNGFILTGPIYDLQTRINDAAKEMAEQCLLEISKK